MSGLRKAAGVIGIVASAMMLFPLIILMVPMIMTFSTLTTLAWFIGLAIAVLALVGGILALTGKNIGAWLLLIGAIVGIFFGIMLLIPDTGDLYYIAVNVNTFSTMHLFAPGGGELLLLGASIECYVVLVAGILALVGND